jgi:hypothetical protein
MHFYRLGWTDYLVKQRHSSSLALQPSVGLGPPPRLPISAFVPHSQTTRILRYVFLYTIHSHLRLGLPPFLLPSDLGKVSYMEMYRLLWLGVLAITILGS